MTFGQTIWTLFKIAIVMFLLGVIFGFFIKLLIWIVTL